MNFVAFFSLTLLALQTPSAKPAGTPYNDPPFKCSNCDEWNLAQAPFKIHGKTYYVGTHGLSSLLIDTGAGLIVLDGGLPQSAPVIEANIRTLGFKVEDIKLIVNSHTHYDHAGGIAKLQRDSGATIAASAPAAKALMQGFSNAEDPQFGVDGQHGVFPRTGPVRVIKNGETIQVGQVAITSHFTPGHTPGGTTWTWTSCEGKDCINMVYADSMTPVSEDGFHFLADATHPDLTPAFRQTIAMVAALPCDIVVSAHPSFTNLFEKWKTSQAAPSGPNPFIDKNGCKAYADDATKRLDARIKTEREAAGK
ncbi:MAG: subclass B3 metallo-beta-lactamase [Vicinamibacteria bacterium]